MTPITLDCPAYYSLRRLSPFQGTLQVVEVPGARALSTDGASWQIQLLGEVMVMRAFGLHEVGWRYFVYGVWARDTGFLRLPSHPGLEPQSTSASLEALLEALDAKPRLPFQGLG